MNRKYIEFVNGVFEGEIAEYICDYSHGVVVKNPDG